jgi:GT2 family glycosyltransferase
MMLRADTFSKVGGFSPEYFMYGEDMDLCAKIRQRGLNVYHVPGAVVFHHGGGSSNGGFSRLSALCLRDSVYHFIRTHQGPVPAAAYRVLMAFSALMRLALLWPAALCSGKTPNAPGRNALRKWSAVLRWSTGRERALHKEA